MRRRDQLKTIARVLINPDLSEEQKLDEIRRIANWQPKYVRGERKIKEKKVFNLGLEQIIQQIQDYSGYTIEELSAKSRQPSLVLARQLAHYKAWRHTGASNSEIGRKIGKKDHATVLHSIKTIQNYLDVDKLFKQQHGEFLEL